MRLSSGRPDEPGRNEIVQRGCSFALVQRPELSRRSPRDRDDDPLTSHRPSDRPRRLVPQLADPHPAHFATVARVDT